MSMTAPMTEAEARRIMAAMSAETERINEDWFSGRIATADEMYRQREALKAQHPRWAEANQLIHLRNAARAARRQARQQARFGS